MHVLGVRYDLQVPGAHSLKEKRAVLRPLLGRLRNTGASISEVDHHDRWQRASVGVAIVGPDARHVDELADAVDRIVWSRADVVVIETDRTWMEWD